MGLARWPWILGELLLVKLALSTGLITLVSGAYLFVWSVSVLAGIGALVCAGVLVIRGGIGERVVAAVLGLPALAMVASSGMGVVGILTGGS